MQLVVHVVRKLQGLQACSKARNPLNKDKLPRGTSHGHNGHLGSLRAEDVKIRLLFAGYLAAGNTSAVRRLPPWGQKKVTVVGRWPLSGGRGVM